MPQRLDPKFDVLPAAQQQIWNDLPAAPRLGFVLYAETEMFNGEPAQVLRAIGYFKDGDLTTLSQADQQLLRSARDEVDVLPDVRLKSRCLAVPLDESN
jgi:hypothetical protein